MSLSGRAHAEGLSEHTLQVGDETRSYLMYQPPGGTGPRPVIIALHGAGQTAEGFRGYFGLDETAKAQGFVAVYPQGEGRVWNDGRPAAMRLTGVLRPGDDVPFLVKLAHTLVTEGIADPSRIYLAGISNGGFMVERMACEFSHVFAGYTAIMATAPANYREECRPSRPVPIMFIHGTADSVIAYSGFWTPMGATLSAPDSAGLFARLNGCGAPSSRDLPNIAKWDGTSVSEQLWPDCRKGAEVRFLTVERGGHQSPARVDTAPSVGASLLGLRNHDIDAGEEAWRFMSAFSLPGLNGDQPARLRTSSGATPPVRRPPAASARTAPMPEHATPDVPESETPENPASAYAPRTETPQDNISADRPATSLW